MFRVEELHGANGTGPDESSRTAFRPLALRPRDAARALGIGQRKLWELTDAGAIPHLRFGRAVAYSVAALEKWLADESAKAVRP